MDGRGRSPLVSVIRDALRKKELILTRMSIDNIATQSHADVRIRDQLKLAARQYEVDVYRDGSTIMVTDIPQTSRSSLCRERMFYLPWIWGDITVASRAQIEENGCCIFSTSPFTGCRGVITTEEFAHVSHHIMDYDSMGRAESSAGRFKSKAQSTDRDVAVDMARHDVSVMVRLKDWVGDMLSSSGTITRHAERVQLHGIPMRTISPTLHLDDPTATYYSDIQDRMLVIGLRDDQNVWTFTIQGVNLISRAVVLQEELDVQWGPLGAKSIKEHDLIGIDDYHIMMPKGCPIYRPYGLSVDNAIEICRVIKANPTIECIGTILRGYKFAGTEGYCIGRVRDAILFGLIPDVLKSFIAGRFINGELFFQDDDVLLQIQQTEESYKKARNLNYDATAIATVCENFSKVLNCFSPKILPAEIALIVSGAKERLLREKSLLVHRPSWIQANMLVREEGLRRRHTSARSSTLESDQEEERRYEDQEKSRGKLKVE